VKPGCLRVFADGILITEVPLSGGRPRFDGVRWMILVLTRQRRRGPGGRQEPPDVAVDWERAVEVAGPVVPGPGARAVHPPS